MIEDIETILFSAEEIQKRVKTLGKEISQDYAGQDILLINVLRGGVIFLSDLIRHIEIPVSVDFMAISSYGSSTESLGVVKLLKDLEESIENRHVLIVEDIIDTGLTLRYLMKNLKNREPASLAVCTLLDKPARRIVDTEIDYKGFEVPDVFVVGYGLDYNQKYRNLPFIGILRSEILFANRP